MQKTVPQPSAAASPQRYAIHCAWLFGAMGDRPRLTQLKGAASHCFFPSNAIFIFPCSNSKFDLQLGTDGLIRFSHRPPLSPNRPRPCGWTTWHDSLPVAQKQGLMHFTVAGPGICRRGATHVQKKWAVLDENGWPLHAAGKYPPSPPRPTRRRRHQAPAGRSAAGRRSMRLWRTVRRAGR